VVASAIRLYYIVRLTKNLALIYTGKTKRMTDLWSHIEACASIIAACLPTLGPIFKAAHTPMSLLGSVRSILSTILRSASSINVKKNSGFAEIARSTSSTQGNEPIEESRGGQLELDISYWDTNSGAIQIEKRYGIASERVVETV
jgi:hypothetical protein